MRLSLVISSNLSALALFRAYGRKLPFFSHLTRLLRVSSVGSGWTLFRRTRRHINLQYTVRRNGSTLIIFKYASRFSFLADRTHDYKKFAASGYIINPPYAVCVTALPCKILITTLVMFSAIGTEKINYFDPTLGPFDSNTARYKQTDIQPSRRYLR